MSKSAIAVYARTNTRQLGTILKQFNNDIRYVDFEILKSQSKEICIHVDCYINNYGTKFDLIMKRSKDELRMQQTSTISNAT